MCEGALFILRGIIPMLPTKTNGLPQNLSSKYTDPSCVGIPEQLPATLTP